jgi:cyanophycinase
MWQNYSWRSSTIVHAKDRQEANDKELCRRLRDATAVWIGGGDQQRLFDRYDGSNVLDEVRSVFARGGIVAGTSAGAAIMSKVMIAGGMTKPKLANGWNLLPNVIVDQHFSQRARFERLESAVSLHPDQVGIGIDESTALFVDGPTTRVIGNGSVYIKDQNHSWVRHQERGQK